METRLSAEHSVNRVTLAVVLNICTCNKPRLHAVRISRARSPAGLSGSVWGAKYMQADGESVTSRSFSPGSVAITRPFHLLIFRGKATRPLTVGLLSPVWSSQIKELRLWV